MTAVLIIAAVLLAFGLGFILGVRSGAQQTVAQVRAIARKAGARSLASGEVSQGQREPAQSGERARTGEPG